MDGPIRPVPVHEGTSMRNHFRFLCAVLLCGAVAAPASAQYLTADEIKKLFGGTTVETTIWRGGACCLDDPILDITLNPDGTLAGEMGDYVRTGGTSDVGKWWTEKNDVFCFQWKSLDDGDKQCARLALRKDGKTIELSRPDGKKFEFDWTIIYPDPCTRGAGADGDGQGTGGVVQADRQEAGAHGAGLGRAGAGDR